MSRDEFFAKAAPLDEQRLRKALWNLYWRGTAATRERIEAELTPSTGAPRQKAVKPADPARIRQETEDFVSLARAGAYIAGSGRVSPKERSRWRFTFKRLLAEASDTLRTADLDPGVAAMPALNDLACEMRDRECFRSDDPIEAAKVVVSDEVSLLWNRVRERRGFAAFAALAAPQLIHPSPTTPGLTNSGTWRAGGITPKLTDAELVTMAVIQSLLNIRSERRWLRDMGKHLRHLFPYQPKQPGYNKRLRAALPLIKHSIRMPATDTDFWEDHPWGVAMTLRTPPPAPNDHHRDQPARGWPAETIGGPNHTLLEQRNLAKRS